MPEDLPKFDYTPIDFERKRDALDKVVRELNTHTVSFALNDKLIGSGTLVEVAGRFGIMTAYHVAEVLFNRGDAGIDLIIENFEHRFSIPAQHFHHRVAGKPNSRDESKGPDLSFLQILDQTKIGTLKSKKTFVKIGGRALADYGEFPIEKTPWFVVGAPAEAVKYGGGRGGIPVLRAQHFFGEARFESLHSENEFDYLKLRILAGVDPYPEHYGGVSGGGLWMVILSMDSPGDTGPLTYEPPLFAGVAFHQSDLIGCERIITGHGPSSIHRVVPALLGAI